MSQINDDKILNLDDENDFDVKDVEEILSNNNGKLYIQPAEMLKFHENSRIKGECSQELLACFQKIASHFAIKFWFTNKCDRESCINYAVAEAWIKWDKFEPNRSDTNIFSFFTTMIANDMRQHHIKYTKNRENHISIDALLSTVKR